MTSSTIAALVSTTPRRVLANPAEERIVKVVPREVADKAAPATKDCRLVAPARGVRVKLRPMGRAMPVKATTRERGRFERRGFREVLRPPMGNISSS
jgi:hypothetical protein